MSDEIKEKEIRLKYVPERDYENRGWKPYQKPYSDLCKNCKHFYKNLKEEGKTTKDFPPSCEGHILEKFEGITQEDLGFDDDEYQELLLSSDPVSWAMHHFGWEARWYQEEMMSCTATKKVVRGGRRIGKTLAISMLAAWMLATKENFSILIVAPFEVQVAKIFDEINKFLELSTGLASSVKRNTRNPCRLEFNNGSKAIGFSSGANSTAGSDKIRGQDADYIIIDEADYINQQDIEAILAILASHPNTGLWASSTPKGTHDKFYQWSIQKDLGFKEFWYISHESPSWTDETDEFFRTNYSKTNYEHEFLAIFGTQEAGVFRNDLVDNALMDYSLPRDRTEGSWITIGVDWNGQSVGTHIVVTEAVMLNGNLKYMVIDRRVIKGTEFSQHEGVAEIVRLNEQYDPKFIYVDAGYGEVQIEMLQKIGEANKKSGLHKKVKPYTMQGNIEIVDPTNYLDNIKKPAKPFMVNWAVQQLEQNRVILPSSEDTQVLVDTTEQQETGEGKGLVQQMRNFSIERYSVLGAPTYSQGEEHTLTAWMLCLVAFGLEFSDLRKFNSIISPIAFVGQPGERITEDAEEEQNTRKASIARQLDRGMRNKQSDMSSLIDAKKASTELISKISSGNKRAAKRYFGRTKINRNTSFGDRGSGRSSF
jgi:hypothetical protein